MFWDGATAPNQNFEGTQAAQVFKLRLDMDFQKVLEAEVNGCEWYVDIRCILVISNVFPHSAVQGTAMRTQYLRTIWPSCGQRVRRRSITRIKLLKTKHPIQNGKTSKQDKAQIKTRIKLEQ